MKPAAAGWNGCDGIKQLSIAAEIEKPTTIRELTN